MRIHTALLAVLVASGTFSTTAYADHGFYRQLDDLAFSATADTRELRWHIATRFQDSHDYRLLLRDVDAVLDELRHVQQAIYRGQSDRLIVREGKNALDRLEHLAEHLNGCDYAAHRPARRRTTSRGGYTFLPETRHGGYAYVVTSRDLIASAEQKIVSMLRLMGHHVTCPSPHVPYDVVPGRNYDPSSPTPLPAPQLTPPTPSSPYRPTTRGSGERSRGFEIPLFRSEQGRGLVLRFGMGD